MAITYIIPRFRLNESESVQNNDKQTLAAGYQEPETNKKILRGIDDMDWDTVGTTEFPDQEQPQKRNLRNGTDNRVTYEYGKSWLMQGDKNGAKFEGIEFDVNFAYDSTDKETFDSELIEEMYDIKVKSVSPNAKYIIYDMNEIQNNQVITPDFIPNSIWSTIINSNAFSSTFGDIKYLPVEKRDK